MTRQKFLFIHQNFPGQFIHVATELARLGHEVVALGIKGREVPGVKLIRYAPKAPERVSNVEAARDFETKIVRGMACAQAMVQLHGSGFTRGASRLGRSAVLQGHLAPGAAGHVCRVFLQRAGCGLQF